MTRELLFEIDAGPMTERDRAFLNLQPEQKRLKWNLCCDTDDRVIHEGNTMSLMHWKEVTQVDICFEHPEDTKDCYGGDLKIQGCNGPKIRGPFQYWYPGEPIQWFQFNEVSMTYAAEEFLKVDLF